MVLDLPLGDARMNVAMEDNSSKSSDILISSVGVLLLHM